MHPRMQPLLELIDENYRALRATADAVPEALRERQPADGCWSVAQVVDHVAKVETAVAQRVANVLAEARERGLAQEAETAPLDTAEFFETVADRTNKRVSPDSAHPAPAARYADAWAALDAAHAQAVAAFTSGDGLALAEVKMPHPVLGDLSVYQWAVALAGHEARHAAQIREAAETLGATAAASS